MRSGAIPIRFDISNVLAGFSRASDARASAVQIALPFITVLAHPSTRETQLADELLIRLKDRRVLSHRECCDGCIDQALRSLQEIRSALVDKQIELAGERAGVLYQLIELMLVAIRQFLTFEQSLVAGGCDKPEDAGEFYRRHEDRQVYFDSLEQLRGHLSRCLGQITVVAGLQLPSDGLSEDYRGPWDVEAYTPFAA